jgi:hypothetical protein
MNNKDIYVSKFYQRLVTEHRASPVMDYRQRRFSKLLIKLAFTLPLGKFWWPL